MEKQKDCKMINQVHKDLNKKELKALNPNMENE